MYIHKKIVIYLITNPLSTRDYDRYGIQIWIDRGWTVRVFDFTKLLHPVFWKYVNGEQLSVTFKGLTTFEDKQGALNLIENLENDLVFIDLIDDSSKTGREIRKAVKRRGTIVKLKLSLFPTLINGESYSRCLLSKIQRVLKNPSIIIRKIANKINQYHDDRPDYLVVSGKAALQSYHKDECSVIKAHSLDYDFFLDDNSLELEAESSDIGLLFLDTNGPYHTDSVYAKRKRFLTPYNYYSAINAGLTEIGKELGYMVSIAAHPRSDYDNQLIKYSFPILKDRTYELIKQSSVIVSHVSASLQWAIIMRKPIILVTTDEFVSSRNGGLFDIFAASLGKEVINFNKIPKNYDWKSQLVVDEVKYREYIETYIKQSETPEKKVWDIVIDRIEDDFDVADIQHV